MFVGDDDSLQIVRLLDQTLNSIDGVAVREATDALDRLSTELPHFPYRLLSIASGGENPSQRVAAATYLKNFTRRSTGTEGTISEVSKEFKDQLLLALLKAEPALLKVLLELLHVVVVSEFVKKNAWPDLVPELRSAIEKSSLISSSDFSWSTVNALMALLTVVKPFQYFLQPKLAKEPVPQQLESITKEILVPLVSVFHCLVDKALTTHGWGELELEKTLHIICKCLYFSVKSHMPSALSPLLGSFCRDMIRILGSLSFEWSVTPSDGYLIRSKAGKRSLLLFGTLVSRHRKYSDKLVAEIVNCSMKIVKHSSNISKLGCLSERIISLAFDVISRVMEIGPGWRLLSPHFSFLLDSAIFPALVLNKRDISEWEEDADEFIRKNLPSELEEISGWREDLFTARKSAMNLLGVLAMSKGPPVSTTNKASSAASKRKKGEKSRRNNQRCMGDLLVLPFLSKFPVPSNSYTLDASTSAAYFGVLMAYGSLQEFIQEQNPEYVASFVRTRVLPIYCTPDCSPYLVASANWVLGELASCLPEDVQNENSPYICYTPSYGYAQSVYNPYNPYIPGASMGVDSSFVGFQQYDSTAPYENAASSPTCVPYVIHPDIVSNSSTDSLVTTDLANGGQSDGRGSRQRNASAIPGLPKNAPKSSTPNSRTYEKLRSSSGQNKQPGIPKKVSTPASGHSLQGKTASVDTVSSSKLLSYGQLDIAKGFTSIASNSYKPRSKMYDGRGENDIIGSPDVSEQNHGPRTRKSRNQLIVKAYTTKAGNADVEGNIVINPDQYNKEDFSTDYSNAKFFVIKSYSEDDVHKSIKYGVWSSTLHGNKKLQSVYDDAQRIATEKSRECPIFLLFSVNASGLFCGVAEMTGPVSFGRDMDFWQQDKWSGSFPVKWHIIKDVPNSYFRHIILQNNENKPVTNSRYTQEIMLKQGLVVLKLFKNHAEKTSLLDDFMYYENRQRLMLEEKARLPFRTFRSTFPMLKPDFSDRSKKISKDVVKKPSVISAETEVVQLKTSDGDEKSNTEGGREDSSPSTLKIGSLTIKSTDGTTFNPTQAKSKPAPSLSSDRKSDSSEEVTGTLADDTVRVGSLPIKVKGSADSSSKIVASQLKIT